MKKSYIFLYSNFCHNPCITVPDLNFLTGAHSQDRFCVDARIFSLEVLLLDLSVTNRCSASEAYARVHNLITYCRILSLDLVFDQDLESFSLKTWVIYCLIKPSRCCCWYHAFLLNTLKFDSIASSYYALHHTMCIIS
jgi:hypothetical protein